MRIFKFKRFYQWAKSENITDNTLKNAAKELQNGLFDANLGNGAFKKRIAKKGHGKRSSFRTIIAFKRDDKMLFILGYSKKEKSDMDAREKIAIKMIAKEYLNKTNDEIDKLIKLRELFEVIQ